MLRYENEKINFLQRINDILHNSVMFGCHISYSFFFIISCFFFFFYAVYCSNIFCFVLMFSKVHFLILCFLVLVSFFWLFIFVLFILCWDMLFHGLLLWWFKKTIQLMEKTMIMHENKNILFIHLLLLMISMTLSRVMAIISSLSDMLTTEKWMLVEICL